MIVHDSHKESRECKDGMISVLITNYNYSSFIESAVISVIDQNYGRLQLVIVDDGSTDGSREIIVKLKKELSRKVSDFQVILLERNGGKLAAINRGILALKGHLTLILDADDELCPGFLEKTVKLLESKQDLDPHYAFIYTDCTLINEGGGVIGRGRSAAFDVDALRARLESGLVQLA